MVSVREVYGHEFLVFLAQWKENRCAFSQELDEMDDMDIYGALLARVAGFYQGNHSVHVCIVVYARNNVEL